MSNGISAAGAAAATNNDVSFPPVVELRRYRLHPGARETLIELFDREFVETQEEVGMRVLGQFRHLDDPDSFVWLRGFPDMPSRADALGAFYGGPVWAAHQQAANATMIDSDDVLLLRPTLDCEIVSALASERPAPGTGGDGFGLVVATILHLDPEGPLDVFARLFESEARPRIAAAGGDIVGTFVTESGPNTFPRLPVREGERVLVTLARYPDSVHHDRVRELLGGDPLWRDRVWPELWSHLVREPEVLRLEPTARSLMQGSSPPRSA
ncbi:MAG TPA: NIPSNAP family protein [Mesorhizobium sp.]|jgi:hypothetical protein|nr:NIPSNAP family protein [Mesorhizobium sp.]